MPGDAEQAGLVVHHVLEFHCRHVLVQCQVINKPRVEIARARAHHQSRRGREAHAGVDALAAAHRREAGAVAQMRENHAALRSGVDRGGEVPP